MRKITKNVVSSFLAGRSFNCNHDHVKIEKNDVKMFFHENLIAIRKINEPYFKITNAGWFSNTTKERLNGLPNVRINQKAGIWYLNGNKWNGNLIQI